MAAIKVQENQQYIDNLPRWIRVRTIIDGEAAMKRFDLSRISSACNSVIYNTGLTQPFLRYINPSDTSVYNQLRNANFIKGAVLYNAVVRTANGLLGMLYRVPPVMSEDLPVELEYIVDNVDGSGTDIDQQSKGVSFDILQIGRDGLFVDMPAKTEGSETTQADVDGGFRPTIKEYKAESIVKWHEKVINGNKVVDLIVLKEVEEVLSSDMINYETKTNLRILRLDDSGVSVEVVPESSESGKFVLGDENNKRQIVGANNQKLTEIPFVFVGSVNNKPSVDGLPMEPIADVNVGHYQESANLAASSFNLSAAQPWIADDSYQRSIKNDQGGEEQPLGEESLIVLGSGGSFNITAPPANSLASELMDKYEDQVVGLGGQLIKPSSGVETAEAAKIRHSSDVSVLDTVGANVSDAYSKSLYYACIFLGIEYKNYRYELNKTFFDTALTAQDIDALVRSWQGGAISKAVLDANMVKGKVIAADVVLDDMNEDISNEAGMPNLDEPATLPVETPPEGEANA